MEDIIVFLIIIAALFLQAWGQTQKKRKEYEQKRKARPVVSPKQQVQKAKKEENKKKAPSPVIIPAEPVFAEAQKVILTSSAKESVFLKETPAKEKALPPKTKTIGRKAKRKETFGLELDEAAKGVIWMEVLSPPRAKNPHPFYQKKSFLKN